MPARKVYPPLLPTGFHRKTLAELRFLCVDGLPKSKRRGEIMTRLAQQCASIKKAKIPATIWVNGSFLTKARHPRDADVAVWVSAAFVDKATRGQCIFLNSLKYAGREENGCHVKLLLAHPITGRDQSMEQQQAHRYWVLQFGFDRNRNPKGIAVVNICGGCPDESALSPKPLDSCRKQ